MAIEIEPALHDAMKQMANVTAQIEQIVDAAESKGNTRGTHDRETNRQLQNLFQE